MVESLLLTGSICELPGYLILDIEYFHWKITHITGALSLWISVITE